MKLPPSATAFNELTSGTQQATGSGVVVLVVSVPTVVELPLLVNEVVVDDVVVIVVVVGVVVNKVVDLVTAVATVVVELLPVVDAALTVVVVVIDVALSVVRARGALGPARGCNGDEEPPLAHQGQAAGSSPMGRSRPTGMAAVATAPAPLQGVVAV
jgi:hypothetical protein